jgi:hypothetical protein
VGIYATNGSINSNEVVVSFNGYDVYEALDLLGDTVSTIYSGLRTDIRAVLSNGGDQVASQSPQLKAYFASGTSGSVKKLFTPHAGAFQDTVTINLPTTGLLAGIDTLVLECDSKYTVGGSTLSTVSISRFPVAVPGPVSLALVSGSAQPDSVYADLPFSASVKARIVGLAAPIDSSKLVLGLSASPNGPLAATIFSGMPTASVVNDSTVRYSGLSSVVSSSEIPVGSTWVYRAGLTVYSGGNSIVLDSAYDGQLTVVGPAAITIDTGSLVPGFVVERDEKPFAFDIVVSGTSPLIVDPATASFRVQTTGFSNSKSIKITDNVLNPGVNHVTTENIIFPSVAAGTFLSLSATFEYHERGVDNQQTFISSFSGKTIYVRPRPTVTILRTQAVTINPLRVNTRQQFNIEVTVEATAEVDNLSVLLKSEGHSQFQGDRLIPHILAYDSATLVFPIIADSLPNVAEVFTSEISSPDVTIAQAADNVEVITIERPAQLVLTHTLVGTVNGVVTPRANFGLNLHLSNSGDAAIEQGIFTLTSGGVPLGLPDPLIDTIDASSPISYELIAPDFDTTIQIQLQFTKLPIDKNTKQPAAINVTGFSSTVYVSRQDTRVLADIVGLGSAVVAGGEEKLLATIALTAVGTSSLAGVRLRDLSMTVSDRNGNPLTARDVFVVGNTSIDTGGVSVSQTTAGADLIKFVFPDLTVGASAPLELAIRGKLQKDLPDGMVVRLFASGIHAEYNNGPLAGQDIAVEGPGGNDLVLSLPLEVTGTTLAGSFVVRENPYSPDTGPAEFRFVSGDPEGVTFEIYTLDGQLVYESELPPRQNGIDGELFEQVLWDGRNGAGEFVRNGVYLVVVTGKQNQEQAILKLAVLR